MLYRFMFYSGIAVFLVSLPRLHTFKQDLFRLVKPRCRVVSDFHIAECPRKVHVEVYVESVGNVSGQLREWHIAETAFTVKQVNKFRQIRLRVLPCRTHVRQWQNHVPVVRALQ